MYVNTYIVPHVVLKGTENQDYIILCVSNRSKIYIHLVPSLTCYNHNINHFIILSGGIKL